eukprot:Pgem_evm1s15743
MTLSTTTTSESETMETTLTYTPPVYKYSSSISVNDEKINEELVDLSHTIINDKMKEINEQGEESPDVDFETTLETVDKIKNNTSNESLVAGAVPVKDEKVIVMVDL